VGNAAFFWIFGGFPPFLTRYEKGPDDGRPPAFRRQLAAFRRQLAAFHALPPVIRRP
jgi:hypothetical protein